MICSLNVSGLCSPSKTRSDCYHSPREFFNLGQQLKPSRERFPFWIILFGSTSGVSRGSCGVDLVCLPLEATTETVESPGARYAIFNGTDF
jgi:hypothetical protein